jgi:hypothetical protein
LGIVGSDHGVIRRKAPLLPVLFGRKVIVAAQVTLQGFEFFAVFQADEIVGGRIDGDGLISISSRLRDG